MVLFVFLLDFRILPTMWYFFVFHYIEYMILHTFQYLDQLTDEVLICYTGSCGGGDEYIYYLIY